MIFTILQYPLLSSNSCHASRFILKPLWDIYSTYYYFKELWIHSPRFNSTYLIQHKNTKTTKPKLDFVQSCYSEILKSVDCYCIFRWAFFDFWAYATLPGKLSIFLGQPFQIPLSIKIIQGYLVKRSLLLSKFP